MMKLLWNQLPFPPFVAAVSLLGGISPASTEAGEHWQRLRQAVAAYSATPASVTVWQPAAVNVAPTVAVPLAYAQPSYYVMGAVPVPTAAAVPASLVRPAVSGTVPVSQEEAALLADRYRALSARLGGPGASPSSLGGSIAGGIALSLIKTILTNALAANPQGFNLKDAAVSIFRGLLGIEADQPGAVRNDIEAFVRGIVQDVGQGSKTQPVGAPGPGAGTYTIQGTITLGSPLGAAPAPTPAPALAPVPPGGTINAQGLLEPASAAPIPAR